MAADTTLLSIVTTLPGREPALALARAAVEARLAACAQVDEAAITSVYRWQGETCESAEWRLTFKTLPRCEPALRALVASLHPYEVPQWIATKIIADETYWTWATAELEPETGVQTGPAQASPTPGTGLLAVLATCLLATLLSACGNAWQGPASPHFDGSRFSNPGHSKESSVAGYLWLRLTGAQATWPERVPVASEPPPPAQVDDGSARVTFVGHATVLIQLAGLNILTDPVWSERASPFSFAGPRRVQAPGVAFDALPRIDLVLISHNHYDHVDLPTLRRLDARDQPQVLVPLGNRALVAAAMPASRVSEHDWGARVPLVRGVSVQVEPMLHGSGRSPLDQQATLWAAYVVQAAGLKLYYVGDSGYGSGELFRATGRKYGGFDLAILPIGAYEPVSFMADSHMAPAEAVKLMADVRARQAMAHHFEAFQLGFEAYDAPRQALEAAARAAGLAPGQFMAPKPGQALVLRPQPPG